MTKKVLLQKSEYSHIDIDSSKPQIIFLYGNLGAGKTTFVKAQLEKLGFTGDINSPTYTYYNKYGDNYHFDLYRLDDYDEFVQIGGEEILDNNQGLIFIEWPELIDKYYTPDITITISDENNPLTRNIVIEE